MLGDLSGLAEQVGAFSIVAKGIGVAAAAYETVSSIVKVAKGEGSWKDGVNIAVGVATGIAMGTGVGEAAVAAASIAWGIYKLF